ncbi:MAG: aminopeptidase N [Methylococcales bacterium]|nr:aminopeptidase N [Methylococcales bacterium]MDD5753257.1 aminopeptidase N [Methylococcales bacterium]
MTTQTPKTIYRKNYTAPDFLIHDVKLHFLLDAENTKVLSTMTLQRNSVSQNTGSNLVLHGEKLVLNRVMLNETELMPSDYVQTSETLTIKNTPQDASFILIIENTINPKENTALEGLYLSNGMLCTQCEAEGFRKITYFLDRPDVMTTFTTTIVADKTDYPVLLSNGNKVASGEFENNQHWVTWHDPFAKPCYLFALVAGQLKCVADTFVTQSGRKIDLEIFVEAHDKDKCAHAMQSLKYAMRWDEAVYGREYDLDLYMIVAVSHFNMGAMENKGLNVFNTKFVLARPDTATDFDYEGIEGVIAHEYFHNWTGNRITCRDWFQLSLKEGFTVFRDQEFTADRTSHAVKRIEDVTQLRTRQFAEDASPLAHSVRPDSYIEINNFYTLTVYEKGAEVVRMLHTLLGVDGFRRGSDLYFERHDGQAVTCDDFVSAMQDANGVDLSQFRRWYSQAGTPKIQVESNYDAATKTFSLTLSQNYPNQTEPLLIPIHLGLLNSTTGADLLPETLLQFNEMQQTFTFDALEAAPIVSILRGFSAPVNIEMPRSLDELAFLSQHDSDSFNRWDASQLLAEQIILELVKSKSAEVNPILLATFEKVLNSPITDLAYFSLLLSLPSENYLAERMTIVDFDGIHFARELVLKTLAEKFETQFTAIYNAHHKEESGDFSPEAIGRRRVKNACLAFLSKLNSVENYALAHSQFEQAGNMTDQMAALSAIVHNDHSAKQDSLNAFYTQWENEPLVIDKWFALQASSPSADAFENVQNLRSHVAFDMRNPNRVRSLIGAFSQANPVHFHAANGQGYAFLADAILELNAINPQVASRMVTPLTAWRKVDDTRQTLMKAQLQRIIGTKDISNDVFELASKSLG